MQELWCRACGWRGEGFVPGVTDDPDDDLCPECDSVLFCWEPRDETDRALWCALYQIDRWIARNELNGFGANYQRKCRSILIANLDRQWGM